MEANNKRPLQAATQIWGPVSMACEAQWLVKVDLDSVGKAITPDPIGNPTLDLLRGLPSLSCSWYREFFPRSRGTDHIFPSKAKVKKKSGAVSPFPHTYSSSSDKMSYLPFC
jgi:hypothetical protein